MGDTESDSLFQGKFKLVSSPGSPGLFCTHARTETTVRAERGGPASAGGFPIARTPFQFVRTY